MPERLLCLRAPGLHTPQFDPSKDAELPKRLLVLPWGANATTQGPVVCNDTTVALLLRNNGTRGFDRPILDFEHSSEPGSATYRGEPAKIAGHGTLEVVPGEGVYMLMAHWTPEGRDSAGGGHYPDLSPVVAVNDKNEVVALKSVALCRHGATPGLVFLSAATPAQDAPTKPRSTQTLRPSPSALRNLTNRRLSTMEKPPATADELMAALRSLLNLAADASPEDVMAGLTAAMDAKAKPVESDDMKNLSATLTKLNDTIQAQGEQLKTLSASHDASARGEILAAATREGKQVPKMAAALPLDQLKLLCAELPVTVPMHAQTPDLVRMLAADGSEIVPPEMAAIDGLMGVSAEDRKKYLA
jgi:phage I-like protein